MIDFFTEHEGRLIIDSIRSAELNTSGEIRVHLEADCKGNILAEAEKTFYSLDMDSTQNKNGVLFFLAPERKEFAVIGDSGINDLVPDDFWDDIKEVIIAHFKQKAYAEGICRGVERVGEKLKIYFPYQEDDVNELPDEISYGGKKK